MSRSLLLTVATAVTLGGLVAVAWGARQVQRRTPGRRRLAAAALLLVYGAAVLLRPSAWPVIDLAVLLGAIGAVVWVEGTLNSITAVLAFLLTAAAVDVLSVSGGLSSAIIEGYRDGRSDLLLYLALVMPIAGRLTPIVGISDLVVGAAAATALVRLGLRPLPVLGAVAAGLVGALAYGIWRGGAPALPFMAACVLLLIWQSSARSRTQTDSSSMP